MTAETAPAGRMYYFANWKKRPDQAFEFLTECRWFYRDIEHAEATSCRVNPADLDRFAALWPGAVVPDPRIQRGTIMLGGDL